MFFKILLLLVLVPLVELALLHELSLHAGWPMTIVIVLITGFIGSWLARQQGRAVWYEIQKQTASGKVPSAEIIDGVLILFAGAFLITPGILTDCLGFLLLVPHVRSIVRGWLRVWFGNQVKSRFKMQTFAGGPPEEPQFAEQFEDGPQVRVVDPTANRLE